MMKTNYFFTILSTFFLVTHLAEASNHKCRVTATILTYDSQTLQLKKVEKGESSWFEVTNNAHEDPRLLKIVGVNGLIGQALYLVQLKVM